MCGGGRPAGQCAVRRPKHRTSFHGRVKTAHPETEALRHTGDDSSRTARDPDPHALERNAVRGEVYAVTERPMPLFPHRCTTLHRIAFVRCRRFPTDASVSPSQPGGCQPRAHRHVRRCLPLPRLAGQWRRRFRSGSGDEAFWRHGVRLLGARRLLPVRQLRVERDHVPMGAARSSRRPRRPAASTWRRARPELHVHRRDAAEDRVHRRHSATEHAASPALQGADRDVGGSGGVPVAPLLAPAAGGARADGRSRRLCSRRTRTSPAG